MNDENTHIEQSAAPSQVITGDPDHATGAGVHIPEQEAKAPEPAKPLSTRDAIAKAFDDQAKAKPDAEEKPEADPENEKTDAAKEKPEKPRGDGGKFAKTEQPGAAPELDAEGKPKAGQADQELQRPSEGRGKYSEPPARFVPEARAKWANVPNEIKAEFHRLTGEVEGENARLREEYEPVQRFAEMAKQSGTTLDKALEQYVGMERLIGQDFGRGIAALAQNAGLQPQQAIGAMLRAFNVTPQQLAQAVQNNPQSFAAPAQRQPQQAPQQPSAREAQLQRENEALRQQAASATIVPVIGAFQASRPDYPQLEAQIATVLKSGVIEQIHGTGLSVEQRLELAYRMAGGRGPASIQQPAPEPAPSHSDAPKNDPAGSLSVRGAPGAGQSTSQKRYKSNREALEALMPR